MTLMSEEPVKRGWWLKSGSHVKIGDGLCECYISVYTFAKVVPEVIYTINGSSKIRVLFF